MTTGEMQERLLTFAVSVRRFCKTLDEDYTARYVGRQLFRAAASTAANYRAASLARSTAEFVAKLGTVREEADETLFWLEFLTRAELVHQPRTADKSPG